MTNADKPRNCLGCRYAVTIDYGYSNYTVEGSNFYCGKKAHPADGFDEWYGEDKRLQFAEECPQYLAGEGIWVDVDGDQEADLSDEDKEILAGIDR